MKTIYLHLICCLAAAGVQAQQLPLFGQYRENHALINPASLSPNYWYQTTPYTNAAGITYRRQWTGIDDGPVTATAHYEHISSKWRSVVGGNLMSDKTGPNGQNGGQLRYSYLILNDDHNSGQWLSVGGSVGYYQAYYRGDQVIFRDAGDEVGVQNLSSGRVEANAGIFYAAILGRDDRLFYCGFSMLQLATVNISEGLRRTPHFYGNIGLYKTLVTDGGDYFLEPSAWVRYVPNTPLQVDLTCRFHTPNYFWVGFGHSFSASTAEGGKKFRGNNLLFEAGLTLGEEQGFENRVLRAGFGYHRTFTRFGADLGNTYELNLTYAWQ